MPLRALVRLSHSLRAPPLELQSRRQAPIPALSCLLSASPPAPEFLPCIPSAAPGAQAACSVPFRSHPPCDSASLTVDHAATVPPRACSVRSLPFDSGPPPETRHFPRNQLPLSISHSPAAASRGRRAWDHCNSPLSWHTSASRTLILEEPWARQPVRSHLAGTVPINGAGTVPVSGAGTVAVARGAPVTGDSSSGMEGDSSGRGKRTSAGAAHEQRWRVPVLIVGAGPVGLTLSFLLSKLGTPSAPPLSSYLPSPSSYPSLVYTRLKSCLYYPPLRVHGMDPCASGALTPLALVHQVHARTTLRKCQPLAGSPLHCRFCTGSLASRGTQTSTTCTLHPESLGAIGGECRRALG